MNLNTAYIDYFLIMLFFVIISINSIRISNKITGINSFSLGIKSFNIFALTCTIIATYVSGSGFFLDTTEFYKNGLVYFFSTLGGCLTLVVIAIFIIPRMEGFLGKVSVASIVGQEFGNVARFSAGILGIFKVSGIIFIQFKIMGSMLHYLFPYVPEFICILITSFIIISYTWLGGITSVIHTDKIQAFCFSISLLIAVFVLQQEINTSSKELDPDLLQKFTYSSFSTLDNFQRWEWISLFLYFFLPSFSPPQIQRISLGITIDQVQKSFLYSAFGLFLILCVSSYIGYLVFHLNPDLQKEEIIPFLLDLYQFPGFKALLIIGIISMCMSTADSSLNIAGILFANDIFFIKRTTTYQKLLIARLSIIFIGLLCITYNLFVNDKGLLKILLFPAGFYMPLVTVPLLCSAFGLKLTKRCLFISSIITLSFIILFKIILKVPFDILPISMLLNFILLITTHYIIEKWEWFKPFGITSQLKDKK